MNEKIRQLAEQAETKEIGYYFFDREKFAQLIIRECIDTVSDCSVEYCTRPQIVNEIKQHFGVAE